MAPPPRQMLTRLQILGGEVEPRAASRIRVLLSSAAARAAHDVDRGGACAAAACPAQAAIAAQRLIRMRPTALRHGMMAAEEPVPACYVKQGSISSIIPLDLARGEHGFDSRRSLARRGVSADSHHGRA